MEWRYHHDSGFHALVQHMENMLLTLQFTPSEIREAAMFAAYLVEMRRPVMIMQRLDNDQLELHKMTEPNRAPR
jgi:hypothetical protein